MTAPRDYWLALAVYHEFRGVPVRKAIARQYLDLRDKDRAQQELFIRLGSLFFQGRTWVKIIGDDPSGYASHLDARDREELEELLALRREVGTSVVRLLDAETDMDPVVRDMTLDRLENSGFLDDE